MLGWMAYVAIVSLLLGAAAYAAERSAQVRRAPTRWVWGASIISSLLLPIIMSSVSVQLPALVGAIGSWTPDTPFPLRRMTASAVQPSAWLDAGIGPGARAPSLDAALAWAWAAASAVIFLGLLVNGLQLHGRKRAWSREVVVGTPVYVSEDVGPAVVGLLSPGIVLPRWLTRAAPETQTLVLAHERSHLEAGDARLLAIAVLLIVTMPWNLSLWWQLRRLRFAIEVDCDARVLRSGHDISRYGEALILVGERQSARVPVVAAMSESRSFLEQRIRKMLTKPQKFAWAAATGLAGLGLVLAASAAEVSPPNAVRLPAALTQDDAGSQGATPIPGLEVRRYTSRQWGFAIDVPSRWNEFPADPNNGPYEVARFLSREGGVRRNLLVFRAPYDPSTTPGQVAMGTQESLAGSGFGHFVSGQVQIGGRTIQTLSFDKTINGELWSCRYFFIPEGSLVYILAFGATDPQTMFPMYDRLAQTFVAGARPAAAASDVAVPAVHRGGRSDVAFRLLDDVQRVGDEGAVGPDGRQVWLRQDVPITGQMFASARAGENAGQPVVYFTLTAEGRSRLAELTRQNVGRRLALVVDGKVLWAPMIRDEIAGGSGQIDGRFTREQAEALALDIASAIPKA